MSNKIRTLAQHNRDLRPARRSVMHEVLANVMDTDFHVLTLKELKVRLKERHQKVSGTKAVLIERLQRSMCDNVGAANGDASNTSMVSESKVVKKAKLAKELKAKRDALEKRRSQMLQRLEADLSREVNAATDLNSLKVNELKAVLKARGLKIIGNKASMIRSIQGSMGVLGAKSDRGPKVRRRVIKSEEESFMFEGELKQRCAELETALEAELECEKAEFEKLYSNWPLQRLINEGYACVGLCAFPTRALTAFKLLLPLGKRLPQQLQFGVGDLVKITAPMVGDEKDFEEQAVIEERTSKFFTIRIGQGRMPHMNRGLRYRLELVCNAVSHQRKMIATKAMTTPYGGFVMPEKWNHRLSPLQQVLAGSVPGAMSPEERAERPAVWAGSGAGKPLPEEIVKRVAVGTQIDALQAALSRTLTLWQGPPGTGKTRTICAMIAFVISKARAAGVKGPKVLATSQSNVAVDNILMGLLKLKKPPRLIRVGAPARVKPEFHKYLLQEAVLQHPEGKKAAKVRDILEIATTPAEKGKIKGTAARLDAEAREKVLAETDVILATTVGSLDPAIQKLEYSVCIVDEAAQSTEPDSLCGLSRAEAAVLVGDPAQLPPTVRSSAADSAGLKVSLFERLVSDGIEPILLDTQFRMHPGLAMYSSKAFYDGRLKSHPQTEERKTPTGLSWPSLVLPVAFVNSESQEHASGTSFANVGEAQVVVEIVRNLLAAGSLSSVDDVGIVTPYSGQVSLFKDYFSDLGLRIATDDADEQGEQRPASADRKASERSLEIRSVDGYQGREKEVIIVSAVRANSRGAVGFLADPRRLNVAITRARRGLILVGDMATLKTSKVWQDYIEWLEKHGALTTISELIPDRKFKVEHVRQEHQPRRGQDQRQMQRKEILAQRPQISNAEASMQMLNGHGLPRAEFIKKHIHTKLHGKVHNLTEEELFDLGQLKYAEQFGKFEELRPSQPGKPAGALQSLGRGHERRSTGKD